MDWNFHALTTAFVTAVSVVLFVTGRIRYDVIAVLVLLALAVSGAITAEQAYDGFGSAAMVLLGSMFIVARAITRTGLAEGGAQRLARLAGNSQARLLLVTGIGAALTSALLNNTAVVAIFMPITVSLARKQGTSPSRLLMPLAYASLYGGMCTVIGTSTNVAINENIRQRLAEARANGTLEQLGGLAPFALFDFALLGMGVTAVGLLWMLSFGRYFLPDRPQESSLTERYSVRRFLTEVLVAPSSNFVGKPLSVARLGEQYGITVLGLVRKQGDAVLAPTPYNYVREGDALILQGEPQDLMRFQTEQAATVIPDVLVGDVELRSSDVAINEAIVPPNSPLVGQILSESALKDSYNANVLAVWRDGEAYGTGLRDVRLFPGDALLLQAHSKDLQRLRRDQMLVFVETEIDGAKLRPKAWLTLLIVVLGMLLAALEILPLALCTLVMALAVVAFRCVDPDEVYEAVDWRVLILTAGLLPLGVAFERNGLSAGLANQLRDLSGPGAELAVLAALFVAAVGLTQVTTNLATGILLTPVAIDLALAVGAPPNAFVLAVLFGASSAFMTPVGHPVNLMIMGPGDYRFLDYLRAGLPQTLLTGGAVLLGLYLFYL